jgi:tRNA(Ile)-lysidine synthase TilS/MesJ
MSSFSNPHFMYLFALKNGKKKIAYGQSPEDALEILAMRLTQAEMDEILKDQYERIHQREMQKYVHLLG